jgi:hypothetical protein
MKFVYDRTPMRFFSTMTSETTEADPEGALSQANSDPVRPLSLVEHI